MIRLILLLFVVCVIVPFALAQDNATEQPSLAYSIPQSELILDNRQNFSNRFTTLDIATEDEILLARNRLRPFCDDIELGCFIPNYEDADKANEWLTPDDLIVGFIDANGQAYAYPIAILNYHGLVNDVLADQPVVVVYCISCDSTQIYSREVNDNILTFGNISVFYQNLMTIFDDLTHSLWLLPNGQGIVGDYKDTQLQSLNSVRTTWEHWLSDYPDTRVLQRIDNYVNYLHPPAINYEEQATLKRFDLPISDMVLQDKQLDLSERVLIVQDTNQTLAYPLSIYDSRVINTTLNGVETVILKLDENNATVYQTQTEDGTSITLEYMNETDTWVDTNTGATMSITGIFTEAPLTDKRLESVPFSTMYWYAALVAYPDVALCLPDDPCSMSTAR